MKLSLINLIEYCAKFKHLEIVLNEFKNEGKKIPEERLRLIISELFNSDKNEDIYSLENIPKNIEIEYIHRK